MQDGPRILVAAALGKIIEPILRQSLTDATIRIAEDKAAVQRAISDRLRFDVVVTDLTWMDYALEYSFDGLDVLNALRQAGRQTPVIFAAQGHGRERDHLDEAVEQPEVVGIYRKATGPAPLIESIDIAVSGGSMDVSRFPPAIARQISCGFTPISKRVRARPRPGWPGRSRRVARSTMTRSRAPRMSDMTPPPRYVDYLGPLIRARREHNQELKMTPEVIYRWCGEHAAYILSWCRRNGYSDIATRVTTAITS